MDALTLIKLLVQAAALSTWTWRLGHVPRELRPVLLYIGLSLAVDIAAVALRAAAGTNTVLYMVWVPVMIVLLFFWLWRAIARRWAAIVLGAALCAYLLLLYWEVRHASAADLLFARSLLLGYAGISALCAVQLLRLTEAAHRALWKEARFWTYLAFFASMGPAIPYLGMLNHLYRADMLRADALFTIIDALFFLQYSGLVIAGLLLQRAPIPLRA